MRDFIEVCTTMVGVLLVLCGIILAMVPVAYVVGAHSENMYCDIRPHSEMCVEYNAREDNNDAR